MLSALAVALTLAMSLIRDDYRYLALGLVLVAAASACNDLATVPYNAMLRQLSTPQTSGQISGFGLGLGYFGSVVLLLVVYFGFVSGDGDHTGLLDLPVADGQNVRAAMLFTRVWFALFALPLLLAVPSPKPESAGAPPRRSGSSADIASCGTEIRSEWQRDHNVVYYLIASAVFRDGLTGVFAFGAVLGVKVYGVSQADVLLFGVSASVIAAVGAVIGGRLDDRFGAKPVIVGALTAMIVVAVHPHDAVGRAGVLDLRAAAVPVHRADAVGGANADAADVGGRQGGRRLRPLHHHRAGGVVPGAGHVLDVHRRVRHRPRRDGRAHRGPGSRATGDAGGEDARPGGCRVSAPRCRSSGPHRCAARP